MRLLRWLKKPQAPQPTTVIEPTVLTEQQLDNIIEDLAQDDQPIYSHGIPNAIPLSPSISKRVRQIPVQVPDSKPVPAQPPQVAQTPSVTNSDTAHATISVAKRMYRESVKSVLISKLNKLRNL